MSRPYCRRKVAGKCGAIFFKPMDIPLAELEEITLQIDELEALRLVHLERLYQEQAAQQMHVSRTTLSRILESAHFKVTDALVHGKSLRIHGGPVQIVGKRCCPFHSNEKKEVTEPSCNKEE